MIQVYQDNSGSIAKLKKHHGQEKVQAVILAELIRLEEGINPTRKMSEVALEDMVTDIMEVGWMLSCEEVHLLFKEIRQGRHGKMYNGLTPDVVIPALNDFIKRRVEHFMAKNEEKHAKTKDINPHVNIVRFLLDNGIIKKAEEARSYTPEEIEAEIKRIENGE
jgi:hypothetical protein